MPNSPPDLKPIAGNSQGRIAMAHLLASDFNDDVDAAVERIGALCSMACTHLLAGTQAIKERLWTIAATAAPPLDQILRLEADAGADELEAAGNATLEQIHILAVGVSLKTQNDAGLALDALRGGVEACRPESGLAASVVLDAADDAAMTLRRADMAARRNIQAAGNLANARIDKLLANISP
ncbi:hypothetical protein WV31_04670 [Magnetospirillum sp. ME-1]|uniref:hypothetical protein n=1 Tax=Magnetospirillum sp. ME-1 TaxID=1639348 RepID=UPI000A17C80C|nr:hypothetical protein [Magnetospirillum sp. ME-1]ARJ65007.1 hypothetical protein WV31_04670 [Magnetospirillum sp. ME-1]